MCACILLLIKVLVKLYLQIYVTVRILVFTVKNYECFHRVYLKEYTSQGISQLKNLMSFTGKKWNFILLRRFKLYLNRITSLFRIFDRGSYSQQHPGRYILPAAQWHGINMVEEHLCWYTICSESEVHICHCFRNSSAGTYFVTSIYTHSRYLKITFKININAHEKKIL